MLLGGRDARARPTRSPVSQLLVEPQGPLSQEPDRPKLEAITLNNLGCLYRRLKDLSRAYDLLKACASVELQHPDRCENPASTMLNLCAVLGSMGRHSEALSYAVDAVHSLEARMGLQWPQARCGAWGPWRPEVTHPSHRTAGGGARLVEKGGGGAGDPCLSPHGESVWIGSPTRGLVD